MAESSTMATSIPSSVPRVREGIDLVRAGLTLEEGFLVSRIDGRTPVEQIAHLFGKPLGETMQVVSRLARAGVIQWGDDIEATRDLEREQGESDVSDPDLLAEPVDLSEDEKREILRVHAHLDQWSAYELLGCRRRDDPSTIKRAYYAHCKSWHPDRFRSAHLGSYDTRIRDIFRAIQEAHRVLSDPDRRAEYDRTHPPPSTRPTSRPPSRTTAKRTVGPSARPRTADAGWRGIHSGAG